MSPPRYPTRLSARPALCWLADAWAYSQHGVERMAFVTKRTSSKVLPWALSSNGRYAVELWDTLHKIHRKKRGFSYTTDHLRRVQDTIASLTPNRSTCIEVWEAPEGPPIDKKLVDQWSEQLGWDLVPVTTAQLMARFQKLSSASFRPREAEDNPYILLQDLERRLSGSLNADT